MEGSIKCSANYVPLTPITFLDRAAVIYPDSVSLVHGDVKYTWKQTRQRCVRLASALAQLGIAPRHVVILSFASFLYSIPSFFFLPFMSFSFLQSSDFLLFLDSLSKPKTLNFKSSYLAVKFSDSNPGNLHSQFCVTG